MATFHFANTDDADMRYIVRQHIPDPFFYIDTGDTCFVVLNALEIGAFAEQNKNQKLQAMPLEPLMNAAKKIEGSDSVYCKMARVLFDQYGLLKQPVEVSVHLPLDMADYLRAHGAKLVVRHPYLPERRRKSEDEIEHIRESMRVTCNAFTHLELILTDAKVTGAELLYRGQILTSEYLRGEIELFLFQKGMECPGGIIISCGEHAAMPHHHGSGPIKPHQSIICDFFPRSRNTQYFADMTRTYVKGEPSDELRNMCEAVHASYEGALTMVRAGISAKEIFELSAQIIRERGFDVGEKGYIHSLGHGIGLSIHEAPSLSGQSKEILEVGNVITIEPGLYYPDRGGVRFEDSIVVTETAYENLTNYDKPWIIP